ncbi:hypothetical protein [Nitratidesulfovibrio sp. 1201_IL3209]|uniref:hypothetical protein n=1 Tax=Nitratidesulfovibrio sp. 1201_IL3209 TaxID=3084053 RepID=UPI002FDA296F
MEPIAMTSFTGASGKAYTFAVYPLGTPLADFSGVFMFARKPQAVLDTGYSPMFIGHSAELGSHLGRHDKRAAAVGQGADCLCVHPADEGERAVIAADLLQSHPTPCN